MLESEARFSRAGLTERVQVVFTAFTEAAPFVRNTPASPTTTAAPRAARAAPAPPAWPATPLPPRPPGSRPPGSQPSLNKPKPQPSAPIDKLLAKAQKKHAEAAAVVARGVAGKYQAQRQAQVSAYSHTVSVLEGLLAGD